MTERAPWGRLLPGSRQELAEAPPALVAALAWLLLPDGERPGTAARDAAAQLAPEQREALLGLLGLGLGLARMFQTARTRAGRALVDAIFHLHAVLAGKPADAAAGPELAALLRRHGAGLRALAAMPRGHDLLMRWIEIFDERLLLHRYSDPWQRRRHAVGLLAAPLRLAVGLPAGEVAALRNPGPLEQLADALLAVWDLERAPALAEHGWNRVAVPGGTGNIGGYFGLADQARPPTAEELAAAAAALEAQVEALGFGADVTPPTHDGNAALAPELASWLEAVRAGALDALRHARTHGSWPVLPPLPAPQLGLLGRLRGLWGGG